MSDETSPTAAKLGTFCRPEMYMQGLMHACRLEGDKPFTGCPFAHFSGKYRLCQHPSLMQSDVHATKAKPENKTSSLHLKLDFNLDELIDVPQPKPLSSRRPPRIILREKCPDILNRIELIWGSIELHNYLKTLTTDHANTHGFPVDVIHALGEIYSEHRAVLKVKGVISEEDPIKKLHNGNWI